MDGDVISQAFASISDFIGHHIPTPAGNPGRYGELDNKQEIRLIPRLMEAALEIGYKAPSLGQEFIPDQRSARRLKAGGRGFCDVSTG